MSSVSREYAQALFMLAAEKGMADAFDKDLDVLTDALKENPRYTELLSSPGIALEERLGVIEATFGGSVSRDVVSFLKILCERKHTDEILECVGEYKAMLDESKKISTARVTSAALLDEKQKAALVKKLEMKTGHKVVIEYTRDESIIGGLTIELDGQIMDASLKRHLKDIKDVISK